MPLHTSARSQPPAAARQVTPCGAGGKVQKPLLQVFNVQGLSSSHCAAVEHCLVMMQSEGSEFGCCDGYEHASRRYATSAPAKSSRSTVPVAIVPEPPSMGVVLLTE